MAISIHTRANVYIYIYMYITIALLLHMYYDCIDITVAVELRNHGSARELSPQEELSSESILAVRFQSWESHGKVMEKHGEIPSTGRFV